MRTNAANAARTKTIQKAATTAANNAVTAQRIRAKLLARLEREIDALPDNIGTDTRQSIIDNTYSNVSPPGKAQRTRLTKIKEGAKEYKLRDLTAAWKDLTADLPRVDDETKNAPIYELIRRIDDACGIQ